MVTKAKICRSAGAKAQYWWTWALLLGLAVMAPSFARAAVITSDAMLSFSGFFFDSATNENVNLAGKVHVMTQVTNSGGTLSLTRIEANLANASGAGQTTANLYQATGADSLSPTPPR